MTVRLVLGLAVVPPVAAQGRPPIATIVNLPASVRAAGMAGGTIALTGVAAGVFENPVIIGPKDGLGVDAGYAWLGADDHYGSAAVALSTGGYSIGGGLRRLNRGSGNGPDESELVTTLATSYSGIHFGLGVDYTAVSDSAGRVARSLTEDFGVMVAFFDIAAVAVSLENLGRTDLGGAQLSPPSRTHLGFFLNLIDSYSTGRLLATVETVWTDGSERITQVGLEGGAVLHGVGLMLRIGHGAPLGGNTGRTTWGASLVLGPARLDYAHQAESALGSGLDMVGVHWTP